MTKASKGRRARPIMRWPKCPQSTCPCSPGRLRRRRYASAAGRFLLNETRPHPGIEHIVGGLIVKPACDAALVRYHIEEPSQLELENAGDERKILDAMDVATPSRSRTSARLVIARSKSFI